MHRVQITTLVALAPFVAWAAPSTVTHSGRLLDAAGAPVSGSVSATFALRNAADAGTWSETHTLSVTEGFYSVVLGNQTPLDEDAFRGRWDLVVTVGGEELGRQPLTSVPSALAVRGAVQVTVDPSVCGSDDVGALRWHAPYLELCDGTEWKPLGFLNQQDGSAPTRAGVDCAQIHAEFPLAPTGPYWINPDGTGSPFQVRCDMETDDGGWIQVDFGDSHDLVIFTESTSNGVFKCTNVDVLGHYAFESNKSYTLADASIGTSAFARDLTYDNPATGAAFSAAELAELRAHISTLSTTTRMVAVACDCDWGDSDHNIDVLDAGGARFELTPGTCYGADESAARYVYHTTPGASFYDGTHVPSGESFVPLPLTHILPTRMETPAGSSGGGGIFGYEQRYVLVR